jgi:hypothetical protein
MGMTPAPELMRLWTQEALDTEQAIGQILQHLVQLYATGESQRAALAQMRTGSSAYAAPAKRRPQRRRPSPRSHTGRADPRTRTAHQTWRSAGAGLYLRGL